MSLNFIRYCSAFKTGAVEFTDDPGKVTALHIDEDTDMPAATLYLTPYARRICPLRNALTALFEEIEQAGIEQVLLIPPIHLGYKVERLIRLLTEWDGDTPSVTLCFENYPIPRNKTLSQFAGSFIYPLCRGFSMAALSKDCFDSDASRTAAKAPEMPCPAPLCSVNPKALAEELAKKADGFATHLFALIDAKGLDDVTCYKRANLDRKIFSKIRCRENYLPSKETALALALALRLNLSETDALLKSAGLALSPAVDFDIIIRYCIENEIYDVLEINEVLFYYDQPLLGV